jgi:hypothetical protein
MKHRHVRTIKISSILASRLCRTVVTAILPHPSSIFWGSLYCVLTLMHSKALLSIYLLMVKFLSLCAKPFFTAASQIVSNPGRGNLPASLKDLWMYVFMYIWHMSQIAPKSGSGNLPASLKDLWMYVDTYKYTSVPTYMHHMCVFVLFVCLCVCVCVCSLCVLSSCVCSTYSGVCVCMYVCMCAPLNRNDWSNNPKVGLK